MKIKYLRLDKKTRKEKRKDFYKTTKGKYIKRKLTTALICALGCLFFAIFLIIDSYYNTKSLWQGIYSICIFLFSIAFFIAWYKIRLKKLNEYVINN